MGLTQAFRVLLLNQPAATPAKPTQAKASYTGSPRVHYGLPLPVMRAFLKDWANTHELDMQAWVAALHDLYGGPSLEEKVFSGLVLEHYGRFRRDLPLTTLEGWLGQLDGWNEVDCTCQSTFTPGDLLSRWGAWEDLLRRLAADGNLNKRRAALVLLIPSLRQSPDARFLALALENVDKLKGEPDKLISKAISWVLRTGIKRHPEPIRAYLTANAGNLPAFVVREVSAKLETGKKQR